MSSPVSVEGLDFVYIKIEELPYYWRLKIKGWNRRASKCPYDGSSLVSMEKPIRHKHCLKCGRNYG